MNGLDHGRSTFRAGQQFYEEALQILSIVGICKEEAS